MRLNASTCVGGAEFAGGRVGGCLEFGEPG